MPENKKISTAFQKRLDYISKTYGNKLWDKFKIQEVSWPNVADIESLVRILASADPSLEGKSLRWIAETYIRGGLRLEDIQRARETLNTFYLNLFRIEPNKRDLLSYKSEASLWESVQVFENKKVAFNSGRAQDRANRDKAYAESKILYEGPEGLAVTPKTEFAAQWWGRGTRWCTSAGKNNYFKYYSEYSRP